MTRRGPARWKMTDPLPAFRASTAQVAGLWPFSGGAEVPTEGAIIGRHQDLGVALPCDPITYFTTHLISAPTMWIQGNTGLGKSSLGCRLCIAMEHMGRHTLVLGDLKGEYVKTVTALGGKVLKLGVGHGHLNVLDHDYAKLAANSVEMVTVTAEDGESWHVEFHFLLPQSEREQLLGDVHSRRKNGIQSLVGIMRRRQMEEREDQVLDKALQILEREWHGPSAPLPEDLLRVITGERPEYRGPRELDETRRRKFSKLRVHPELREVALDHGNEDEYRRATDGLVGSLRAISTGGGLAEVFGRRTTISLDMTKSAVFDIHNINVSDSDLRAAALVLSWNWGFGQVDTYQVLADFGVVKRVNYLIILDELWRMLSAGTGMVDRINSSTRLNRTEGVGTLYITHSLTDLSQVSGEDLAKAVGIAERCHIKLSFGIPKREVRLLRDIQNVTDTEETRLTTWARPGELSQGKREKPAGVGHFMLWIAGQRGIPGYCELTPEELLLHDTNERWEELAKRLPVAT
jgi:hypothetical protein